MTLSSSRCAASTLISILALLFVHNATCARGSILEARTSLLGDVQAQRRSLTQQDSNLEPSIDSIDSEACGDHPPPGSEYSCDEQKEFGKCYADFIKDGDYCRRTCGRCHDVCNDITPPGRFTCADQKKFRKCDEPFLRDWGYCALTCEKCNMKLAATAASDRTYSGGASSTADAPRTQPQAVAELPAIPRTSAALVDPTASATAVGLSDADTDVSTDSDATRPAKANHRPNEGQTGAKGQAPAAPSVPNSRVQMARNRAAAAAGKAAARVASDAIVPKSATAPEPNVLASASDAAANANKAEQIAAAAQVAEAHEDASTHNVPVAHGHKKKRQHHSRYVIIHSVLMAVAFGFVTPLGVFTSRYGKRWGHWFNVHRAVQVLGYLIAAAGFFLGLALHKLKHMERARLAKLAHGGRKLLHDDHSLQRHSVTWLRRHKVFLAHKYLGIAIFMVLTLQIAAAIVRRPQKGSRYRVAWSWLHWLAGWASLAAGLANCSTGVHLLRPLSSWWIFLTTAVLSSIVGVLAVMETRRCMYGHRLEGYKTKADEDGGLELVGSNLEERQGLKRDPHDKQATNKNGHSSDDDDEELTMVTSKYVP